MLGLPAAVQELEPRAYSASLAGTNFLVLACSRNSGGVVFDPTLPVEEVTAQLNGYSLGYFRSIMLLGRSANISLGLPYAAGSLRGKVQGEPARITRSGLADPRLRLAVNLIGAPVLNPNDFGKYKARNTLGASLTVSTPLGQYDPVRYKNSNGDRS